MLLGNVFFLSGYATTAVIVWSLVCFHWLLDVVLCALTLPLTFLEVTEPQNCLIFILHLFVLKLNIKACKNSQMGLIFAHAG